MLAAASGQLFLVITCLVPSRGVLGEEEKSKKACG